MVLPKHNDLAGDFIWYRTCLAFRGRSRILLPWEEKGGSIPKSIASLSAVSYPRTLQNCSIQRTMNAFLVMEATDGCPGEMVKENILDRWIERLAPFGVTEIAIIGRTPGTYAEAVKVRNARGGPQLIEWTCCEWNSGGEPFRDNLSDVFIIDANAVIPSSWIEPLILEHRAQGNPITAPVQMNGCIWPIAIAKAQQAIHSSEVFDIASRPYNLPCWERDDIAYDPWRRGSDGLRPAVFLDRDGTLIEFVHYLDDPGKVRLAHGAVEALRRLHEHGWAAVVVTNQAEVGRGRLSIDRLEQIHWEVRRQLADGGVGLNAIYFNACVPRSDDPTVIDYPDRKPGPGMLQRAARDLGLRLSDSWMIGDTLSDAFAGQNAGCRGSLILRGSHSTPLRYSIEASRFRVIDTLPKAVDQILMKAGDS